MIVPENEPDPPAGEGGPTTYVLSTRTSVLGVKMGKPVPCQNCGRKGGVPYMFRVTCAGGTIAYRVEVCVACSVKLREPLFAKLKQIGGRQE